LAGPHGKDLAAALGKHVQLSSPVICARDLAALDLDERDELATERKLSC
jgi:hypothetical protein